VTPRLLVVAAVVACTVTACARGETTAEDATVAALSPQDSFFTALAAMCGQAFEGRVAEDSQADSAFAASTLVMHVRECNDTVLRVPFHVGDNRSRTWVISRTATGLRLKHDHRHEDGSEDSVTQYGGDSPSTGSGTRQEFAADAHTAALIPAAATNVWSIELVPGSQFTYGLRREGTDRRFFVAFDLTRPVATPPAPWGFE
jgi:hypothetical protein